MVYNCGNCGHRCDLEQWNFRLLEQGQKWKVKLSGFACTALAHEGFVVHMILENEDKGTCEMWKPRKGKQDGKQEV